MKARIEKGKDFQKSVPTDHCKYQIAYFGGLQTHVQMLIRFLNAGLYSYTDIKHSYKFQDGFKDQIISYAEYETNQDSTIRFRMKSSFACIRVFDMRSSKCS